MDCPAQVVLPYVLLYVLGDTIGNVAAACGCADTRSVFGASGTVVLTFDCDRWLLQR